MTAHRWRGGSADLLVLVSPLIWLLAAGMTALWLSLAWAHGPVDFSLFLESSRRWRAGTDPYAALFANGRGINLNPPATLALVAPLTTLPFRAAFGIWFGLQIAGLAFGLWFSARHQANPALTALLSVSVLTGGIALQLGQVTFLLMPLATLAWMDHRRSHDHRAGLLVGLLAYVKPFYALYLVFWLWQRNWRSLTTAIATLTVSWGITFILWRDLTLSWLAATRGVSWQAHVLNASVHGVAARLFSDRLRDQAPYFAPWMVSRDVELTLVTAAALAIAWWSWLRLGSDSKDREWSVVGCVALLLSPLGWTYYFPLLAPSLVATVEARTLLLPLLLLNIPGSWIESQRFGQTATALAGSFAFWLLVYLWLAALHSSVRGSNQARPA